MKSLRKPILAGCVVLLVALAAPAISQAKELQVNGRPLPLGSVLKLESVSRFNIYDELFGTVYCDSLKLNQTVVRDEHSEPFKGADYGNFSTEGKSEVPSQSGCISVQGASTRITWAKMTIDSKVAATPNGPAGAKQEGVAEVAFSDVGGAIYCGWEGKVPYSYNSGTSTMTLRSTVRNLKHGAYSGGSNCGGAGIEVSFKVSVGSPAQSVILR